MLTILSFARKAAVAVAVAAMITTGGAYAMPFTPGDVAVEHQASKVSADEFIGFWEKEDNDRIGLTITPEGKGCYGIEISWPRNSRQVDMYTMSARPAGDHVLQYTNCKHYLVTFSGTYVEDEELLYKDGTGTLRMVSAKRITWQDDQEHKADGAAFVPLSSPLGGGL